MINITFPDNSVKQFEAGVTPLEIAKSISPRLAEDVLAASVDGAEWDLSRPISADASLKLFKWDDPEGKHAFWHSSAHLLAEALQELYPGVKFGIGPAIEMVSTMTSTPQATPSLRMILQKSRTRCLNSPAVRPRLSAPTFPKPTRSSFSATGEKNINVN